MFEIENNVLIKYNGTDEIVIIPGEVEIINSNAFDNNEYVEKIIGNNVKIVSYNSLNTPNLKALELPKVKEIQQLNNMRKLEYLKVNANTQFSSIRYLNPNLNLEIVSEKGNTIYTSNPELINKFEYTKNNCKQDFFLIVFNKSVKRYAMNKNIENYTLFLNNICCIEKFFSNIPEKYKEIILNEGYNFCILNDKLVLNDEYIGGLIYKDLELGLFSAEDVNDCFSRELARIIDDYYYFSSNDDIYLCYKLEAYKLYSKTSTFKTFDSEYMYHIIQNPHEYFCECFSRFYKKDLIFKEECPFTWDYIAHLDLLVRGNKTKEKIYK